MDIYDFERNLLQTDAFFLQTINLRFDVNEAAFVGFTLAE